MKPFKYGSVLVIANQNMMLATAIADHLSTHFERVDISNSSKAYDRSFDRYPFLIIFAVYPLSNLLSRLTSHRSKDQKLLLVLDTDDRFSIYRLRNLDFDGIISIESSFSELLSAVNTVFIKQLKYLSPWVLTSLSSFSPLDDPFACLSLKERDVAVSLIKGRRNIDIASELNISQKPVNSYKTRIYKKLTVDNDLQFFRLACKTGAFFDKGFFFDMTL